MKNVIILYLLLSLSNDIHAQINWSDFKGHNGTLQLLKTDSEISKSTIKDDLNDRSYFREQHLKSKFNDIYTNQLITLNTTSHGSFKYAHTLHQSISLDKNVYGTGGTNQEEKFDMASTLSAMHYNNELYPRTEILTLEDYGCEILYHLLTKKKTKK